MNEAANNHSNYFRIIAFWAICEGFAGGILHAVHMPFSGLLISSFSTLCIVMLAKYCKGRFHILRATVLVCIFKLMLSPHTPPTAYLAVGFQGLIGQMVFLNRFNKPGSYILAILALVESSVQKLLVMVLIYGTPFWKAVNAFIQKIIGSQDDGTNYVNLLAASYILVHFIAGIFVGWWAIYLVRNVQAWQQRYPEMNLDTVSEITVEKTRKKSFGRLWMLASFFILLAFYLQSKINPQQAILPTGKVLDIFLRAFLIISFWLFLLAPLMQFLIQKYLRKWADSSQGEVQVIVRLLPEMKNIFLQSIKKSKQKNGRISPGYFLKMLVVNVLK
jgi:hypothetical protein